MKIKAEEHKQDNSLLSLPLWRFALPHHIQTLEEALHHYSLPSTTHSSPRLSSIEIDHYHDTYLLGLFDGFRSFSPHLESRFGSDSDGLLLYTVYCLGYLRGTQSNPDDPAYVPGLSLLSLFGLDILQSCCKQNQDLESKLSKLSRLDKLDNPYLNTDTITTTTKKERKNAA